MSIYRMTLRFNLEDETERNAAEFLKQLDRKAYKSKNRFVVELIAAYADSLNKERLEDELLEKIRLMFREEIADISVVSLEQKKTTAAVTELTEEQKAENAASVLADLELFG